MFQKIKQKFNNLGALRHKSVKDIVRILDDQPNRLYIVFTALLASFVLLNVKLLHTFFFDSSKIKVNNARMQERKISGFRVDIVDRNAEVISRNIKLMNLYANPAKITGAVDNARVLVKIFPELQKDYGTLVDKLKSTENKWVLVKKAITPAKRLIFHNTGLSGYFFEDVEKAIYPHDNLFSHVIGLTSSENEGLSGIQKHFNAYLSDPVHKPLQLSLDTRVQTAVRDELQKQIEFTHAKGGVGIVMKIKTGEVMSMVSLPDFNLNLPKSAGDSSFFNQATLGAYELGSVFKVFTVALGIENGIPVQKRYDITNDIVVGSQRISDYHKRRTSVDLSEIIIYSSNLGAAQVARDVGKEKQIEFLRKLGFLSRPIIELPEKAHPIHPAINNWKELNLMTIAFGHGIAVAPIQVVSAFASILNDGKKVIPTLLKVNEDKVASLTKETVVSQKTSQKMKQILREVVTRGSGGRANIEDYDIGGKTSTAEKIVAGKYSKSKNISSFTAAFPISSNPEYVVFVLIDEPAIDTSRGIFTTTGGSIAAPVVAKIVSIIGPKLNVQPTPQSDILSQ